MVLSVGIRPLLGTRQPIAFISYRSVLYAYPQAAAYQPIYLGEPKYSIP
jgi:hypothetical protein